MPAPATIADHGFSEPITLRDATQATIRVMRPNEKGRLVEAFSKLGPQSVYLRFFSFRKELSEKSLDRIDQVDFVRLLGLVATIGSGGHQAIIGSSTYVADSGADGQRSAEVAFTIEADYQGQGLGGKLLEASTRIARRHGIARFTADVLASNTPMLKVFERSGLPLRKRREGSVVHLDLDLAPQAG